MNANLPLLDNQWAAPAPEPALAVSYACPEGDARDHLAREAYSYRLVYEAFAPLLKRWGAVYEVAQPESRLDFALRHFRRAGKSPLHLSFHPLHLTYLTSDAPNVAFPFWEFPDIPAADLADNPRNNWRRIAGRLSLLLTACTFTRDAVRRAGVTTPVAVVPVPLRADCFRVPEWVPDQRVTLDCPAYVFPQSPAARPAVAWDAHPGPPQSASQWLRWWYGTYVRPCLPADLVRRLSLLAHPERGRVKTVPAFGCELAPRLELSGVVYTAIFNPFCQRKNWADLLSAFLHALGDRPDATLVLKLAVCRDLAEAGLEGVLGYYLSLGMKHRCKIAVIPDYLAAEHMLELARASTFHVTATRAEGANLPLQDFLAAGRPGVAPRHSAMLDYFHDELGFVVASHPEPARWPHAPHDSLPTTWHHPVWESLRDQLRLSYETAKSRPRQYRLLAARSREQIEDFAGAERVWPRLAAALNTALARQPRDVREAEDDHHSRTRAAACGSELVGHA